MVRKQVWGKYFGGNGENYVNLKNAYVRPTHYEEGWIKDVRISESYEEENEYKILIIKLR